MSDYEHFTDEEITKGLALVQWADDFARASLQLGDRWTPERHIEERDALLGFLARSGMTPFRKEITE